MLSGFVLPLLEYCPSVWSLASDTHLKLLDRAVSDVLFLTGGVFECDIARGVLCMLYNIRCKAMHPLNGALHGQYVPVRVYAVLWSHIGTLMHRLAAEPRSTAGLLFPSRCPCGMMLLASYSMVWDWRVSRAGPMLFYWPKMLYPFYNLLLFFPSLLLSIGWYCDAGVFGLIGCISLSLSLALPTFFNNNNNINLL